VLGNPLRRELMLLHADGRSMSATDATPAVHRPFHMVRKHQGILREAGLLLNCQPSNQDARFLLHYMPEQWRPRAGVFRFRLVRHEFHAESNVARVCPEARWRLMDKHFATRQE